MFDVLSLLALVSFQYKMVTYIQVKGLLVFSLARVMVIGATTNINDFLGYD